MILRTFFGHDIDYSKAATMFTIHHVILVLFGLTTILLTLKYANYIRETFDHRFRIILIALLVFLEITYHIHNWTYPRFSVPLHICSFAVIMNVLLLLTRQHKFFEYAFFFGTLGGAMALLFPNSLGYTYLNFRYYHFIILHSAIMMVPLYFYKAYEYRVDYHTLIKVFKSVIFMALIVYILNGIFKDNYWFINEIPDNVSNVFQNYYVYIATFITAVFTTMNILYFTTHRVIRTETRTPKTS